MQLTRAQRLVLGFFALAWLSLLIILVAAPGIYDTALHLPGEAKGAQVAFVAAISAFLVLLGVGVVRRWRWVFWLILIAFLAGVLRVPVALLEIAGVIPTTDPTWYVVFQMLLGLVQCVIGVTMLVGYRSGGMWAPA
jgi:hypothetical protein